MGSFHCVSERSVKKRIRELPSKSCKLDPLTTTLLKSSSRSKIEMGGQGAKCLVMALCLELGGQRSCLVHILIHERCKMGARGPWPPWIPLDVLLKSMVEVVTPVIAHTINVSLLSGEFFENLKDALLKLLIKIMGLELFFKSFSPISNLSYVSKLIEICSQSAG